MKKHSNNGLNVEAALKQPVGYPAGIYFNMPDEEYHADCALSHSGMKDLLVHEYDYWVNGPLNPNKAEKQGKGMDFGKKCHMKLLQPELFKETYRSPSEPWTGDHRRTLNIDEERDIKESMRMLGDMHKSYFTGGYPEVSIFWTDPESNLRCRIRVDYLRTFGGIDYKRCKSIQANALGWFIADYAYDIQHALYVEGIKQIKRLLREGKAAVQGEVDPVWLKAFMEDEETLFMFVFQRSTPPFVYEPYEMDDEIQDNAKTGIYFAKKAYLNALAKHGARKEWPAGSGKPKQFSIYNLPRRIFDRGEID